MKDRGYKTQPQSSEPVEIAPNSNPRKKHDMTKRKQDSPSAEYSVGYGKPPEATRFQRGQSGNRRGRPPEKRKDTESAIHRLLGERFVVVERGRRRRIPAEEVIYRQQRTKAMSGDLRAAKYLSERKERSPSSEAPKLEDPYDLSRLTDDELGDLERLLSKAAGETPDASPGRSFG
jgi:hypothetical protein